MKERSKAAIVILIVCICGVIVPQTLTSYMHDPGWGAAMSFFSMMGAIIAFIFALVAIWQDGEQDEEEIKP
jgi:hypothetical protein